MANDPIDFDARYTVDGSQGIAFYLTGYAKRSVEQTVLVRVCSTCFLEVSPVNVEGTEWGHAVNDPTTQDHEATPADEDVEMPSGEFEDEDDYDHVIAIMVGDDRKHIVEVGDLTKLDDLDYCTECGQIGCTADGRDRENTLEP